MPLDDFQTEVATIALGLPSAGNLVLVGGAAMLAYGLVDRPTYDIDLFTAEQEDVAVVAADWNGRSRRVATACRFNASTSPSSR